MTDHGKVAPELAAVSSTLQRHYARTFERHGATARGVDWGADSDVAIRYDRMLAVIPESVRSAGKRASLLDVGCGFGGLLAHARERGISLDYTGIDLVAPMIENARKNVAEASFLSGDVFGLPPAESYEYVVSNGVLTQKMSTDVGAMERFAYRLIDQMFALCSVGIAFNIMSDQVNYRVDNLFYRSPVEMLAHCLAHVSRRVRIDHAYPLYEYTVYVYKEAACAAE